MIHDAVALLAATDPDLFQTQHLAGDVETTRRADAGATLFDRRQVPEWRSNMEVVMEADVTGGDRSDHAAIGG